MRSLVKRFSSLVAVAVVIIAACAPAATPAATPTKASTAPAATPTKAPAVSPTPAVTMPKRGGTFLFSGGVNSDPIGWAPTTEGGNSGDSVWNMTSCKLVKWDNRPGHPTGATAVTPDLAESWENPTPTKYIFHLRKGVKTNTGKEVTSADVKWTLQLLKEKSLTNIRSWYGGVDPDKDLETPDPYTVIFNLPKADADFLTGQGGSYTRLYFNTKAAPTNDAKWTKWGGFYQGLENIDGCGAWKGVQYQAASFIVYEKRNDYWELGKDGKPLPYLDKIEHRYIFDTSAMVAALRAGQIVALPQFAILDLKLVEQIARESPNIVVDYTPGSRSWPMYFDLYTPPWNDIRVRRAVSMATDRKAWMQSQFNGRAKVGYGLYPVLGEWFLDLGKESDAPGSFAHWWNYHPDEARQLMKDAGYPNGFEFQLLGSPPTAVIPYHELWAGLLKKELNITAKVTPVELAVYGRTHPDQGIRTSSIRRPELKSFVWSLQHPGLVLDQAHNNRPVMPPDMPGVKEYKALVEKQQATLDPTERLKLVHEMQRMGADNVFMFFYPMEDRGSLRYTFVKDWEPYQGWSWGELLYTWLDK